MTAHRTRRATRCASLLALLATGAITLTACHDSVSAAGSSTTASAAASAPSNSSAASTSAANGSGTADAGGSAATAQPTSGTAAQSTTRVRTQTLADGSKAEIYRLAEQRYRAKIVNSGQVLATLETDGHDAGLDANDMFIVLTLGGDVHSWMGGDHQGPGTFHLAGGWTAKVTKTGEQRFRAQIIGNNGVVATLQTDHSDVGLDANGVYIVLSAGGIISAHE